MFLKLIGLVLPPVIDLINKHFEDSRVKFLISFIFCAVIGTGSHFIVNGGFVSLDSLSSDILSIFALSQVTYQLGYADSKIQKEIRG